MDIMNFTTNYISVLWILIFLLYTAWLWIAKKNYKFDYIILFLNYGFIILFFFLIVNWHCYIYYLRYALLVFILPAAFVLYKRSRNLPLFAKGITVKYVLSILVMLFIISLNIITIKSYFYRDKPIELAFPLKNGTYCIANGGNSKDGFFMNLHTNPLIDNIIFMRTDLKKFMYAADIVKLDNYGLSSKGIIPKDFNKYEIFSETIYSPCDGYIVYVYDSSPDIVPVSQSQGPQGNSICIKSGEVYVTLGHIKSGSSKVKSFDEVVKGQPIAEVGNSGMGNHYYPHLHIHALKNDARNGEAIPFLFNDRFPVRNQLFVIKEYK